jgi:acyl-coenzyme A synthetase/AMP-(fatty) acid ligase
LTAEGIPARIGAILELDPDAPAVEFEGQWSPWSALARTANDVGDALTEASMPPGTMVGVLLRNRPVAIGLLLGVLRANCCVVVVNSHLGLERVRDDLASLDLPVIVGETSDVDVIVDDDLRRATTVLAVGDLGGESRVERAPVPSAAPATRPGVAVRMLTSGTTGPPKRIDLGYSMFERVMQGAKHYESNADAQLRLREGVVIVNAPLVHLGGLFRVLQAVLDGRRIALLERFTVDGWADAVRRHHPKTVSLVPTALRMVLDADLDPADLASVRSVVSGTAPLDPDVADAFTAKYGVPVLTSYAATEFGGGVAGWNLADHQEFGGEKRGSVGRAHAGCDLRVVDQTSGAVLAADEVGLLEVRAAQLGNDDWVRTTDLARIDADGFLWILGRADQTILRGGMKVQPDVVRVALERDPEVRAAAVVGLDDERLGQVPVAAVELRDGSTAGPADLLEHARVHLARYELPAEIRIVETLPRTPSAKVELAGVRALFADPTDDVEG